MRGWRRPFFVRSARCVFRFAQMPPKSVLSGREPTWYPFPRRAQLGENGSTGANAAAGGISANANALDIFGKWSIPDDENPDAPQSIVLFYKKSDGTAAAKMIAIYHNGKIDDTEAAPKERAKKINGHPFLCGYDFIHSLIPNAQRSRFAGKVVDPDSGKTYDCEVWFDARRDVLVVRGELLIFGVNQYWPKTR